MDAYNELKALWQKLYNLNHLIALADWDLQVMMPPKGAEARGAATSELSRIVHDLTVAPRVGELLVEAEKVQDSMPFADRANLREMRRIYENETQVPEDLVGRKNRIIMVSQPLWVKCRANNDVQTWIPMLKQLVELTREEGRLRAGNSGKTPYDALLAVQEPGMTVAKLDAIYENIKSWLPQLYKTVLENRKDVAAEIIPLETPIAIEKQEALNRRLMSVWQFDFDAGRFDVSAHPFGGMVKEDVRMTAYYSTEAHTKSMLATVHETGHARYEQMCGPREMLGQPVCMARSGGIHETQSLLGERIIAKSASFAEFVTPLLKEYLGDQPALTVENVRKIHQLVAPSYIRTLSDDLGYPLHVILRYEIERDLINGKAEAEDVPRLWNAKMKEYFGLDTEGRDDIGCLQDIHWAACGFASFPAYSVGMLGAAQIGAAIRRELGDEEWNRCIRTGQLTPILEKQREKIWSQGCLHETDDLMTKATGEPLNPKYLREHLERRYLRNED